MRTLSQPREVEAKTITYEKSSPLRLKAQQTLSGTNMHRIAKELKLTPESPEPMVEQITL
jgi:hypothetical protein